MLKKQHLTTLNPVQKAMLIAFLGYTGFAFADLGAKWLTQSYSVYQVIFMDHLAACFFLCLALPWLGGFQALKARTKFHIHFLRAVLNLIIALTFVYSVSILPIADVYTFVFTKPFYAAILGVFLYGQIVKPRHWGAIIVGFIGILVALQPGTKGFDPFLFVPLFCAFVIALMFTISKSLEGESMFSLGFWPLFGTLFVVGPLMIPEWTMPSLFDFGVVALTGAFIAVAITSVSSAFRMAPAAAVSPFLYTEMIWALIFGYLIFADVPDLYMLIGAAIIVGSGLYLIFSEKRTKKTEA